jgi:thiamine pyrophosphate-dependent acetolactate synthase large subunit-like protein
VLPVNGVDLVVGQLSAMGVEDFFYLIGGPMSETMERCIAAGMRGIDMRDERAAAYAAVAYSRVTQKPAVVMACSGPGTINTVTGVAHANADGAPVVVIGGSAATYLRTSGVFQETDQVGVMRPITKWAHQAPDPESIPEAIARAFQTARSGAPGPVYLDLPSDVLYAEAGAAGEITQVRPGLRAGADPAAIDLAVSLLGNAERPVIIAGSGVLWSQAWAELRSFAHDTGIPCYTTPITRGLIGEDDPLALAAARSTAFREADCLIVVGTRDNYILNYLRPPVVSDDATLIEINVSDQDLSRNRVADVAILADAKLALTALARRVAARPVPSFAAWTSRLAAVDAAARAKLAGSLTSDEVPIHPMRLCGELESLLPRDAVRVVDGHETLGFARRGIAAYLPGRMLTPGPYGTMGVGLPFAIGAKVALPSSPVVVLTGDGAFGYHAMELDTAKRHSLGIVVVVANNGGWTAGRGGPGRFLGFTDYSRLAGVFGCFGSQVTEPGQLKPAISAALEHAERESSPAVVNVEIAVLASSGRSFSRYTRYGTAHYAPV